MTSVNMRACTDQMRMPSASGIAVILAVFGPCSRKESGFNPKRKLLPGRTVVVKVQAIRQRLSKANSGDHARRALFVNSRPREQRRFRHPTCRRSDILSFGKGARVHVTAITPSTTRGTGEFISPRGHRFRQCVTRMSSA